MRAKPSILAAAALAAAALALGRGTPAPARASDLRPPGCKPTPPIDVRVLEAQLLGDVAVVAYEVRSLLDAEAIEARVEAPPAVRRLGGRAARLAPAVRGSAAAGRERLRLAGARASDLRLVARVTFRATGGELDGRLETHSLEIRPFAAAPAEPELQRVAAGSEVSLEVPAVRRKGGKR